MIIKKLSVFIAVILLLLVRIVSSEYRTIIYDTNSYSDERLMLEYSDLEKHFDPEFENPRTLQKTMTFSWFINLPRKLGISLNKLLALCWGLAAILTYLLLLRISRNRILSLIGYATVLFCPAGFEFNTGVHFYRNLIIAPFLFIFFCSLLNILYLSWNPKKTRIISYIIYSVVLSIIYPMCFYIKEDGFWMKPVLYFFLFTAFIGLVIKLCFIKTLNIKRIFLFLVCLVLPIVNFNIQTAKYLKANEKSFNYSDITLRTGGSFASVANQVYKIASDERTYRFWAPRDAIKKAIDVSPTLQSMPDLIERIDNFPWYAGTEIPGDFLPWVMLFSLEDTGRYTNAADIEKIYSKIDEEIRQAFENGSLKKDQKFQLTKSAGGRSVQEIFLMFPDIIQLYETVIFLKGYDSSYKMPSQEDQDYIGSFTEQLNQDLTYPSNSKLRNDFIFKNEIGKKITEIDFNIYRIWIPVLFFTGILSWLLSLLLGFKKIKPNTLDQWLSLFSVFVLMGISFAYATGIVWFSEFLVTAGNIQTDEIWRIIFYGVGIVPMIYLSILIAMCLTWSILKWSYSRLKDR